ADLDLRGARRGRHPVDEHSPGGHQLGHLGPAAAGEHRHHPVDSLPCQRFRDLFAELQVVPPSRTELSTSSPIPTQRATSATLNTGHHWRSTKSTTWPPRKPPPSRR